MGLVQNSLKHYIQKYSLFTYNSLSSFSGERLSNTSLMPNYLKPIHLSLKIAKPIQFIIQPNALLSKPTYNLKKINLTYKRSHSVLF